jgi:oligoendopeptidase F
MTTQEMIWDLSQLVGSTDSASIKKKLEEMVAEAEKVRNDYRGKIGVLDAKGVSELLESKDALTLKNECAVKYCFLMYAANSTDETAKQLNDAARRAMMQVGQKLAFVDIELGKLVVAKPGMVKDSKLTEYRHYLERLLRRVPHMLSETEEQLVIVKDKNGINAWETLQSDWLSTRMFQIEVKGEKKTLPYGQMVGFYQNPDRDLRKRAYQTVYETVGKDEIVWASAIRSVCEDHTQMCELRKWQAPMTQSLIDNDVDEQAITSLMKTIEKSTKLYQK